MNSAPATVLAVDDQELMRDLLERLLRVEGYNVLTAASGASALSIVQEQPVDLVLLDMMMPGMSGIEVLQQLKANPATRDLPVIVISADSDIDRVVTCIHLGAEDYIVKPYNAVVLNARVSTSIEKRRLRQKEQKYQQMLEQRVAERTAALERSEAELRSQSTILRSILDSMGDGVVVVDMQGRLLHHNPAATEILGAHLEAMLPGTSTPDLPFYHGSQDTPCAPEELPLEQAIRGETIDAMELRAVYGPDTPNKWLNITARPLREQEGAVSGGVAVVRDISAAKQAEIVLRESEQRYALAANGVNDGLWDWQLEREQIYFSPRWKEMLGYTDDEIGDTIEEWLSRVHPDDHEQLETRLAAHRGRLISHLEFEYRIKHKNGEYRWMLCRGQAVWSPAGTAARMAGSQTDITDRKLVEQQLMHDALHDGLTGLPNRALFVDRLDHALNRSKRNLDYKFAVLFLDLDRFKNINDSLGHTIGDDLLKTIAKRLTDCLRPGDTVARLGGDEFTILLDDFDGEQLASDVIERIQRAVGTPLRLGNQDIFISVSIGIVASDPRYTAATELIRDADTAMYQAKMSGKARAVLFNPDMHAQVIAALQLESDLRWALERNELQVHYQPIVSLETGYIVGVEALLRWQHPQRGLLYPPEFLAIAEETGLIVPIDWWVLEEACRQMRAWQEQIPVAAGLWVNVNFSEKQLAQPDVVQRIRDILEATGLPASKLKLEITEHTLLAYGDITARALTQIRQEGIQLCIDDFGTGYSSLSYLQRFPVDVLKIDRSFINQLGEKGQRSEIVQTIIALARALSLQSVAEGTETIQQVQQLRELQCTFGQGWLFSKALAADAIETLVRASRPLLEGANLEYV